jgi:hypothetical protein
VAEAGDIHGMVSSSHMWMMVVTIEKHNEWVHPRLTKAVAEVEVLRYRTKLACAPPLAMGSHRHRGVIAVTRSRGTAAWQNVAGEDVHGQGRYVGEDHVGCEIDSHRRQLWCGRWP